MTIHIDYICQALKNISILKVVMPLFWRLKHLVTSSQNSSELFFCTDSHPFAWRKKQKKKSQSLPKAYNVTVI